MRSSTSTVLSPTQVDRIVFFRSVSRPIGTFLSFEFLIAMVIFGGSFKANPSFAWLFPVDPTFLFFAASLAVGIPLVWRNGIPRRAVGPICLYFLFCAWAALSVFWTEAEQVPPLLYHISRVIILNGWIVVSVAAVIASDQVRTSRFLAIIVFFALAAALDWALHAGSFMHLGFLESRGYQGMARLTSAGLVILFGFMMFSRFASLRWFLYGITCLFFFYNLLIMGARGPLISTIIQIFVMIVLSIYVGRYTIRIHAGTIPSLVVAVALIAFLFVLVSSGMETWTLRRLYSLSNVEVGEGSAGRRLEYIIAALHYWGQSFLTVVFGNGMLSFPEMFFGRFVAGGHPHNVVIEILVEYGIVGLVLFSLFVLSIFKTFPPRMRWQGALPIVLISLVIGSVFFSLTSGDMVNLFYFLVYSCLLLVLGSRATVGRPAGDAAAADDAPARFQAT